ncbi:MAG: acylphosphatase [Candidatus Omnitrophica bacterium]|nr:acylphosphatase [Candidatus Omnitrophota bacterium]
MQQRVHVFYSGRVQGVGFRMTAEETAKSLGVMGWVKNLRDGRVEIVAEAEEAALKRFLEAVQNGPMKNFIQRADISWSGATEAFDDFEIRYY